MVRVNCGMMMIPAEDIEYVWLCLKDLPRLRGNFMRWGRGGIGQERWRKVSSSFLKLNVASLLS